MLARRIPAYMGLVAATVMVVLACGCAGGPGSGRAAVETEEMISLDQVTWRSGYLRLDEQADATMACYRKDLYLTSPAREARLTFYNKGGGAFWVKVNGEAVEAPAAGRLQLSGLINMDVTPYLHGGNNVITWQQQCGNWGQSWLAVDGIVFCEDGSTQRILTDDWTGGWDLPAGWDQPGYGQDLQAVAPSDNPVSGRPDEVYQPPYHGPIHVQAMVDGEPRVEPIVNDDGDAVFRITLVNMRDLDPDLQMALYDEETGRRISERNIRVRRDGRHDLAGTLNLGRLPQGAYLLRLILTRGGEEIERRDLEVASVGVIEQRVVDGTSYEDGLALKRVDYIDCTAPTSPETFVASFDDWNPQEGPWEEIETKVVEGPAGRYRTFAENKPRQFFAYKFGVENLYRPHLAVVEWPDDARRNFICHVYNPAAGYPEGGRYRAYRNRGFQRGEASVIMDADLHPRRSNEMKKLHILFWPIAEQGSIHITNVGDIESAAAMSRVTIYEITNDLPALNVVQADPDRMIGYHTERGPVTMSGTYYAGPLGGYFRTHLGAKRHPGFLRNWFITTENWIKRMRFTGQNLYLMGQFMYQGTLYPSQLHRYGYNQNSYGGRDAVDDYVALILRMFERNNMVMVFGIEHMTVPALMATQPSEQEIRDGVDHLYMVGRDGKICALHSTGTGGSGIQDGKARWPAVNYFHPEIQKRMIAIVQEPAARYKDYPAWKGVALFVSRVFGPMDPAWLNVDNPDRWGYEDYTVELFEKETGIDIPVDPKDPERFEKRYQWITANAKAQWTDWRCEKYTELFRKMRDAITRQRPDMKLHVVLGEPMDEHAIDGHFDDPQYTINQLRKFGIDIPSLRAEQNIVVNPLVPIAGSAEGRGVVGSSWREKFLNATWLSLFGRDETRGVYVKGNIPHYGNYQFPEGRWLFTNPRQTRQGWFWSTYVTESFVNVMARSNPAWMPHTWMDQSESTGRIHEIRQFGRAYLSVPNGDYERLTGNGLDRNIWIARTVRDGVQYMYAANLNWWTTYAALRFDAGARVRDLIMNRPVELDNGVWSFSLPPYTIQTFRVEGEGALRSATAAVEGTAGEYIERQVRENLAKARKIIRDARARATEISDLPGWKAVQEVQGRVLVGEARLEMGDLAGAYVTTCIGAMPAAMNVVVNEALQAMPMLAIGPFGTKADTNVEKFGMQNPEVAPDYRGMETGFLGETENEDGSELTHGWRADPDASHEVYPGVEMQWKKIRKLDRLSFHPVAHSPHPYWMVSYAYTEIYSPESRNIVVHIGSDNAMWVYLNDEAVVQHGGAGTYRGGQRGGAPDQNRGRALLQEGWNRLLVKVVQRERARYFLELTDTEGRPLTDLRYRVPGEE